MQRILKFESFMPKNLEKRVKDLEVMQAKELKEYEIFIKEFQTNFLLMKDKTSDDPQEQLFIDLIKDTEIKLHQIEYPFIISLDKNDIWFFFYDWKNDDFCCKYDGVWKVFESKFNITVQTFQEFIKDMLEKHFKFKLATISIPYIYKSKKNHFKFKTSSVLIGLTHYDPSLKILN